MTYRCRGCRQYHRGAPYRRIGLSQVCSPECLTIAGRSPPRHTRTDDTPPEVRAAVLARDRHRCRYCGRTTSLHLHHIHYRSEGVDHSETNLITLCKEHHDLVHTSKRRWQPLCEAYVASAQHGQLAYLIDLARRSGPT